MNITRDHPDIQVFREKAKNLIQKSHFLKLMTERVTKDNETRSYKYLKSRGFNDEVIADLEAYDLPECWFNYKGKNIKIEDSILIPLRAPDNDLKGVWIRFLDSKRFYIWLIDDSQKYWISLESNEESEPVIVTESIFDALSLRQLFGFKNIAACLGVKPSNSLTDIISNKDTILALDRDTAGYKSMLSILETPETCQNGILVLESKDYNKHVDLTNVKDYNEILETDINDITDINDKIEYRVLRKIQAKVYLRSKI